MSYNDPIRMPTPRQLMDVLDKSVVDSRHGAIVCTCCGTAVRRDQRPLPRGRHAVPMDSIHHAPHCDAWNTYEKLRRQR